MQEIAICQEEANDSMMTAVGCQSTISDSIDEADEVQKVEGSPFRLTLLGHRKCDDNLPFAIFYNFLLLNETPLVHEQTQIATLLL